MLNVSRFTSRRTALDAQIRYLDGLLSLLRAESEATALREQGIAADLVATRADDGALAVTVQS